MARSLVISHEEEPSTNWLLTGFLFVAVGWMVLAALAGGVTVSADAASVPIPMEADL